MAGNFVQEFLDLRTLSINNILISTSFAICLFIYSQYHRQFDGIKSLAFAFLISSASFTFMALRNTIPDFLSIVLPNTLLILCVTLIHISYLRFYKVNDRIALVFHVLMVSCMAVLISYYTYIENSVNSRILAISVIASLQCFYIMATLLQVRNNASFAIAISYFLFAIFFAVRVYFTAYDENLTDFMDGGLLHSLSVFVYELMVIVSSFGMVWLVSYKVHGVLREQASHDPLTKVLNRRALENIVNSEHARSLRSNVSMSVIMLDIDHFKRINDQYGHCVGDEVLVDLASLLIKNTRQYDSIARVGGEEFIILLPNTTLDQAKVIAENLRLKISKHKFKINDKEKLTVTASFGATECDLVKDGWLKILQRADNGLYQAKAAGRNQVIAAS